MFEDKTSENIKNEILNSFNLDMAKNEGSFLSDIASGTSIAHASFYTVLDKLLNIAFIEDSYEDNLDKRVKEFGIDRKSGERALGQVTVHGKDGVEIHVQDEFMYLDKKYICMSVEGVTTISDGTAKIIIQAENVGSEYNIPNTAKLSCIIDGVEYATDYIEMNRGTNDESDEELKERFFYIQAHKGTSGNVDDYKNWALNVDGVRGVKVIPLWNGNGTVKVVIMSENNRNVSEDVIKDAKEYIESKRPIGAKVTVVTPTVLDVNIGATVELIEGVDIEQVKAELRESVDAYLVGAVNEITYTKIAGVLSKVYGVADYSNLTINGNTRNIKLVTDQVGAVGSINLSKGVID